MFYLINDQGDVFIEKHNHAENIADVDVDGKRVIAYASDRRMLERRLESL